jgi:hypothetical protein
LQDEITEKVVTALDVKLSSGEQARVLRKCLVNPKAREHFYTGVQSFFRMNAESMARARACFERVAELVPDSAHGPTWVALTLWFEANRGWVADPVVARDRAGEWAERAASMPDADGQALTVLKGRDRRCRRAGKIAARHRMVRGVQQRGVQELGQAS